jgi:hypothetical protein
MLSQDEFEQIIADPNKYVDGDIIWDKNKKNPPAFEFRVDIISDKSYPLIIKGWYNSFANKLSYAIIHTKSRNRIYALDLGEDHQNPDRVKIGRKHKHRWFNGYLNNQFIGDRKAYVPSDITALADDPVGVWEQFCLESRITHNGIMQQPQVLPLDL